MMAINRPRTGDVPPHGSAVAEDASHAKTAHIPVLLHEVLTALVPQGDEIYLDGTFGAGGYTRAILDAAPKARVIALDRDPAAIADGQGMVADFAGRLTLVHAEFSEMEAAVAAAGIPALDGVVLDIGVSSMQLDQALRGFSFRFDGPLDMRMSGVGESAADIVNSASEARLADIFYHYGEERLARPLARAIVADRAAKPFTSTKQLADLAGRIIHSKPGEIHPATRSFQALRIAVNDELGELARALHAAERLLKPGGRLVVVSFHSLEDRIVKTFFAARSGRGGGSRHAPVMAMPVVTFKTPGKWPVMAGDAERDANPRARSAKLRAGIRTAESAQPPDQGVMALAALPQSSHRQAGAKKQAAPKTRRRG